MVVSIAAGVMSYRDRLVDSRSRSAGSWESEAERAAASVLTVFASRTKDLQIRGASRIEAQFGDVPLAILIPVGHLEFSFEKPQ
jgi:hypothetical protein